MNHLRAIKYVNKLAHTFSVLRDEVFICNSNYLQFQHFFSSSLSSDFIINSHRYALFCMPRVEGKLFRALNVWDVGSGKKIYENIS